MRFGSVPGVAMATAAARTALVLGPAKARCSNEIETSLETAGFALKMRWWLGSV